MKFVIWALVMLSGCIPKTQHFFNAKWANLETYQTYNLYNAKLQRTQLEKNRKSTISIIDSQIKNQMAIRDYALKEENPDLLLRYEYSYLPDLSASYSQNNTVRHRQNNLFLLLTLKDRNSNKLIWQCSYESKVSANQIAKEQAIEKALVEIFFTYPYSAQSKHSLPNLSDIKKVRKELQNKHRQERKEMRNKMKNLLN